MDLINDTLTLSKMERETIRSTAAFEGWSLKISLSLSASAEDKKVKFMRICPEMPRFLHCDGLVEYPEDSFESVERDYHAAGGTVSWTAKIGRETPDGYHQCRFVIRKYRRRNKLRFQKRCMSRHAGNADKVNNDRHGLGPS